MRYLILSVLLAGCNATMPDLFDPRFDQAIQLMQPQYQYQPMPAPTIPHSTFCTTRRAGNQLHTTCN